jgi:hypothetical protein
MYNIRFSFDFWNFFTLIEIKDNVRKRNRDGLDTLSFSSLLKIYKQKDINSCKLQKKRFN